MSINKLAKVLHVNDMKMKDMLKTRNPYSSEITEV